MIDDNKYILRTYARQPIELVRGEGVYVWDATGKRYIDFHSGIAVNSLGHSHPRWVAAIQSQATSLTHVSNLFFTAPQTTLAQQLLSMTNGKFDKVFFCNSGTEANEAAMKFVKKYQLTQWEKRVGVTMAAERHATLAVSGGDAQTRIHDKSDIVAFTGAFHGRTLGSLSITYKWPYRAPFTPLINHTNILPFNDIAALESSIGAHTAGIFLEPIQGEGGVNPSSVAFMTRVGALCRQHDTLLVVDEVQCGLSRTGSTCAHQHEYFGGVGSIEPDIMTLAKPLAGGLPIGAVLMKQKVADAIKPGDHGSTFSGGPLICSAASVVVDELTKPSLLANVAERSQQLKDGLKKIQQRLEADNAHIRIVDIRGLGLLIGLELNVPIADIIGEASSRGLMMISAGENIIRLCPPLIVDQSQIQDALNLIEEAIIECNKKAEAKKATTVATPITASVTVDAGTTTLTMKL